MQIRYDTAQSMGYSGPASGLLDAETNLKFGVRYLSGAYKVGDGNADRAVHNYASGYNYAAKKKGLLEEVGLRKVSRISPLATTSFPRKRNLDRIVLFAWWCSLKPWPGFPLSRE